MYNFCAIYIKHMQFVLFILYVIIRYMGDCHTAFEFGKIAHTTRVGLLPQIKGEKATSVL